MTEAYWQALARDVAAGKLKAVDPAFPNQMARIHHQGIIVLCFNKGLSPQQSKQKGRELAELWWKDREKGAEATERFWK
jgi:hypothetical protein